MTRTVRPWVTRVAAGRLRRARRRLDRVRTMVAVARGRRSARGRRRPADLVEQWDRDRFVQPALSISAPSSKSIAISWRPPPLSNRSSCRPSPRWASAPSWAITRTRCCRRSAAPRCLGSDQRPGARMCAPAAPRSARSCVWRRRIAAFAPRRFPSCAAITPNFRIFCLASAGSNRGHAFTVEAVVEHVTVMLQALVRSSSTASRSPIGGSRPGDRRTRRLGDRSSRSSAAGGPGPLDHVLHGGVRFQMAARSSEGIVPLIDGGVRLGGEAHVEPPGRLRRERDGVAARAAAVSTFDFWRVLFLSLSQVHEPQDGRRSPGQMNLAPADF